MRRARNHSAEMGDELDTLIGFLGDTSSSTRARAAEFIQGLTGSDVGISKLATRAGACLPKLLHLLGAAAAESKYAATALVNLTVIPEVATLAVEKGAVERVMELLRENTIPADLLLKLLTNLTNTDGGVSVLTQEGKPLEGFFISKVVHLLAMAKPPSMYDYAASIITNFTRHPIGRRVFLDPKRGLMCMALASLIPGQSEVRRVGVAAAIRNCCLDDLSCTRLLATPCAAPSGNNSFDVCCSTSSTHSYAEGGLEAVRSLIRIVSDTTKSRELSDAVRQCCAEAIAALARQAVGRDALVACDAPQLIRVGYAEEDHAETCAALEATATIFMSHGLVPEELQPPEGLRQAEILEGE